MERPIYTQVNNCRDCYRCVRRCPVKAIKVMNSHPVIVEELCTYCGTCVKACPNGVKTIRNDVDRVKMAFLSKKRVIASVAPSYVSEFEGYEENFLRALYRLGFSDVSETAIGATLVSEAMDMYISEHGSAPFISTACPSVVELITKYRPEYVKNLAPFPSPLQAHSAYLRHLYGNDITIVFIGPCIAKKLESEKTPGYPDIALTFTEVKKWLEEDNIQLDTIDTGIEVKYIPCKAGKASIYPVENGQIQSSKIWDDAFLSLKAVATSGSEQIKRSLSGSKDDQFIEFLNCGGGCINGPGTDQSASPLQRQKAITRFTLDRLSDKNLFEGDAEFAKSIYDNGYAILAGYQGPVSQTAPTPNIPETEIQKIMLKLGKHSKEDELNCGGCGYPSCREMAKAIARGRAEVDMCVTKMRRDAESKVDILLSTIPHGVVIVDDELKVADLNKRFVDLFEDYPAEFLDADGLKSFRGSPIDMFVPFADKFSEQFFLSKPSQYRFNINGKVIRVTFFLVETKHLLGAMFEDITTSTVKRESVVSKAEDVINKSLETVQQIASLLGDNAAETEIVLNSIIDEFNIHAVTNEDYGLIEENSVFMDNSNNS